MKFKTHHDIKAPIDYVFQRVSNFEAYERQALRRGAQGVRVDGAGPIKLGSAWDIAFTFRNKDRQMRATITKIDAPDEVMIHTDAKGLVSDAQIALVALSPQTTRVQVTIDMAAKSLAARLLLQSLKLARANLNNRLKKRVGEQLRAVQEDYARGV